jgi:hypothetical protein
VSAISYDFGEQLEAITDSGGAYRLVLPAGLYEVRVTGGAQLPQEYTMLDVRGVTRLDLGPAPGLALVTVRLPPGQVAGAALVQELPAGSGDVFAQLRRLASSRPIELVTSPLPDRWTVSAPPGRYSVLVFDDDLRLSATPVDVPSGAEVLASPLPGASP